MAKKKTAAKSTVPLDSHKHPADSRANIPTRELAEFVPEEGIRKAVYARDRSLDPQLVWKGKDEQDARDLEVPAVPIYVQEKIHPQAIIEDVRERATEKLPAGTQLSLFDDFNGIGDFQKTLQFYQHDQHWTNRLILGDSLMVMASLAEKERLRGKVQCIYFDPPYGIKFGSNWQVSTRKRDVKDAKAEDLSRQPEQIKAFRDTWELGIHSYLTYLRDRLTVARDLLTESGSIFVQIGDENVHLVRSLLDEVFGSENAVSLITFKKTTGAGSFAGGTNVLASTNDYLVWYAKHAEVVKYRQLYLSKVLSGAGGEGYSWIESSDGTRRKADEAELLQQPVGARIFTADNLTSQTTRTGQTTVFPVELEGKRYAPNTGGWKTNQSGMKVLGAARRLIGLGNTLRYVRYFHDFPVFSLTNFWDDTTTAGYGDPKSYVVQTNSKVVERCILMTTDPGDLVLDPTCGSGTTAYVAEQWGRRWITTDTSRVALTLARTRLMAARFPYYLLADSPEGRKKQAELTAKPTAPDTPSPQRDLHKGFVYRTVPHVTLKSIANNPDIREGMTREQIDAAIAKHADTETLYDQPYEDKSIVRLTGPFTVESLSPHKALAPAEATTEAVRPVGDYQQIIRENLFKSGVKGTDKAQRITFARLDAHPGQYVHAEGETPDGTTVRVSIGPDSGTVGDAWIADAAVEAKKGSKCDLLLVCAFAFEGSVHEKTAELQKEVKLGNLRVLPVRINPDLAMFGDETGKELLKKTGNANLFTVFGEPDLSVARDAAGQIVVTIRGLDVFDPATGEVRSGGTDDIACWFIDTDYDGRSFFVRHAYFLGANEPYEKLKKALRAEIDEAEWSKLYSATSQPFDPPAKGKIAVKVINHFGDEVLKVYPMPELTRSGKSR